MVLILLADLILTNEITNFKHLNLSINTYELFKPGHSLFRGRPVSIYPDMQIDLVAVRFFYSLRFRES